MAARVTVVFILKFLLKFLLCCYPRSIIFLFRVFISFLLNFFETVQWLHSKLTGNKTLFCYMVHWNRTCSFFLKKKKDRLSVHSTFFVRLSIWTPASFDTTIHLRVGRFGTRTHIIVLIFRTDLLDFARWWKHSLHKKKISPFCLWISFFLHSSFIFFCYPIMRHMSGQDFSHIFRIWGRYYIFFFLFY